MANLLTAIRLLLVIPVAWSMADEQLMPGLATLALIGLAIATDYFDGIVARATGTASPRGMLFDHSTDFLFVTLGLTGAAMAGLTHWLLPLLIVLAFTQYVLDSYFLFRDKQLRMSFLGRWNGVLYFVPIIGIALARSASNQTVIDTLLFIVQGLAWILMTSTVASIVDRGLAPFRQRGTP